MARQQDLKEDQVMARVDDSVSVRHSIYGGPNMNNELSNIRKRYTRKA